MGWILGNRGMKKVIDGLELNTGRWDELKASEETGSERYTSRKKKKSRLSICFNKLFSFFVWRC